MKFFRRYQSIAFLSLLATAPTVGAQTCEELLNLTFSPNAGDIAAHPSVSNIAPWTNGSETTPDPFNSGLYEPPEDDFGNDYAGLFIGTTQFGFQWGFEGTFDLTDPLPWEVCFISFDYHVLGHNGEADLALALGPWSGNAPLPTTEGPPLDGPAFPGGSVAEEATGSVTFDFSAGLLTVTRDGYASYTSPLMGPFSLYSGTHAIDILVSNTAPLSEGAFDVQAGSGGGLSGFYRIDNFILAATPVPEPSSVLLLASSLGLLLARRRRFWRP